MTEKQKYIGAFLDGYFSSIIKEDYGFIYFNQLEEATKEAKKKWKKYKRQLKDGGSSIEKI